MTDRSFDVAISFGFKDEDFATRLHDLLAPRLEVFLYSKRQEMLAGTDGEATFNSVFGKDARLVVVLFREAWGQSPFTRFEETAIRNRAFTEGYDFTIFIPMDEAEKTKVPAWLPKNRLYVGLERWGIEGAAAAIEARFSELGGSVHAETLEGIAMRAAQKLDFKRRREEHLSTVGGVTAQRASYEAVCAELVSGVEKLKTLMPAIGLTVKQTNSGGRGALALLSNPAAMSVTWRLQYSNVLEGANLEATLWRGHPPWPGVMLYEESRKLSTLQFKPDLCGDGEAGWKGAGSETPHRAEEVAMRILKFFVEAVGKA